ncbi:MAG TPA: 50S ribosomal protein L21 [Anaerolineales bacterium]|nr:50S ribosomal protein L21 [Anaerolineales bacterium]
MKYAIVESGGKQYKAVEGETIAVDRLPVTPGEMLNLERVLLLADGDQYSVGTPLVSGFDVLASVVEHFRGEKVLAFRYSPKKRIRVHRGHRQDYTRLMIESIGKAGEPRKTQAEKKAEVVATQPEVQIEADDLVKIEGIGPKVAQALTAAGITTFAQLAESSVEDIQKIVTEAGLKMMSPEGWIDQAKLAAKGDWKGFEKLQAKLVAGRKAAPAKSAKKK